MRNLPDTIIYYLILFSGSLMFIVLPFLLTILNVYNMIAKKKKLKVFTDWATVLIGSFYTFLLFSLLDTVDWDQALYIGVGSKYHTPISSAHILTPAIFTFVSLIGYLLLRYKKYTLPPLVIVLCISSMYIGCITGIMWILQLSPNTFGEHPFYIIMFFLYPFNYIILTISLIRDLIKEFPESIGEDSNKKINKLIKKVLKRSINLPLLAIIMLIPLLGVLIAVLMVLGQEPDSFIKAFTETSDWLFSTKISPEPIPYEGHYLCTVAAGGHKKIVKPLRAGVRRGHIIVVNRQLCIANAFEDLIHEKSPVFHKFVRHIYDKYGYPISKHIKTQIRADIVYILMKPLEWFFLIILYLFDVRPENRIQRQYSI